MYVESQVPDQSLGNHVGISQVIARIHPDGGHTVILLRHQVQHDGGVASHAGGSYGPLALGQGPAHDFSRAGIAEGGVYAVQVEIHFSFLPAFSMGGNEL